METVQNVLFKFFFPFYETPIRKNDYNSSDTCVHRNGKGNKTDNVLLLFSFFFFPEKLRTFYFYFIFATDNIITRDKSNERNQLFSHVQPRVHGVLCTHAITCLVRRMTNVSDGKKIKIKSRTSFQETISRRPKS